MYVYMHTHYKETLSPKAQFQRASGRWCERHMHMAFHAHAKTNCYCALRFMFIFLRVTPPVVFSLQPERVFDQDKLDETNMLGALRGLMFGDFMVQGSDNKVGVVQRLFLLL